MKKLPYTLKHTIEFEGESFGPHENKPTPVGLILTVLMMQGMRKPQAIAEIEKMEKGENESEEKQGGSFEEIPYYSKLVENGLEDFESVAIHPDLTEIDGIGEKSRDKILEYVAKYGEYEIKSGEQPEEESEEGEGDSVDETDEPES